MPGPEVRFLSLHVRLREDHASALNVIARYDEERMDRTVYAAELHRAAVNRYIAERRKTDPELDGRITLVLSPSTEVHAIMDRVGKAD